MHFSHGATNTMNISAYHHGNVVVEVHLPANKYIPLEPRRVPLSCSMKRAHILSNQHVSQPAVLMLTDGCIPSLKADDMQEPCCHVLFL